MITYLTDRQRELLNKVCLKGLKRDHPSLVDVYVSLLSIRKYPYYLEIDLDVDFEFKREYIERNIDRNRVHIPGKYRDLTEIPAHVFNEYSKHELDYHQMVEKVVEASLVITETTDKLDTFRYTCYIRSKKSDDSD